MAGFMDGYGVADARREKTRNRILIALALLLVTGGTLYFLFRNYREEKQAQLFLDHLRNQRYAEAYQLWGCSEASPCRDYSMKKFLEDWGKDSAAANVASVKITKTRSCSGGIIQTLDFGKGEEVLLWVNRGDLVLGFAPWPVCNPRFQPPAGQ